MNEIKPIEKGNTVKYNDGQGDGWYRVTCVRGNTCNLGAVFGGKIYYKRVPLDKVVEDHEAWYQNWTQSESYQCM